MINRMFYIEMKLWLNHLKDKSMWFAQIRFNLNEVFGISTKFEAPLV